MYAKMYGSWSNRFGVTAKTVKFPNVCPRHKSPENIRKLGKILINFDGLTLLIGQKNMHLSSIQWCSQDIFFTIKTNTKSFSSRPKDGNNFSKQDQDQEFSFRDQDLPSETKTKTKTLTHPLLPPLLPACMQVYPPAIMSTRPFKWSSARGWVVFSQCHHHRHFHRYVWLLN